MKVKLLENMSSDAGRYGSFKNIRYGEVVEAEYINHKQNSIHVLGAELNRIGATVDRPELLYVYGDFEVVEVS
tara:strand:- start:677 stop:895 length:219 start_codon:yes stop_codon:yes gene_type:complete